MAVETPEVRRGAELAGLDALELSDIGKPSLLSRIWAAAWPKLAAIALVVVGWQLIVLVRVEARVRASRPVRQSPRSWPTR